jgi:rod shape-determining protein MreB
MRQRMRRIVVRDRIDASNRCRFVGRGIVLAGGGALLRNLDVLLREETGLPVSLAADPLTAVVMGAGKVFDQLSLLHDLTVIT